MRVPSAAAVLDGSADPDVLYNFLKSVDCLHSCLLSANDLMKDGGSYSDVLRQCDALLGELNRHLNVSARPIPAASELGDMCQSFFVETFRF